jgi:hypothetical protein
MCGLSVGLGALALCSFNGGMVPQNGMASIAGVFTPMIGCFVAITLKRYCNVLLGIYAGQFILSMINLGQMSLHVGVSIRQSIPGSFMILLMAVSIAKKKDMIVEWVWQSG